MKVHEQIIDTLEPLSQNIFTTREIRKLVHDKHGTNRTSVNPPDLCYNRINSVTNFNHHIFLYLSRNKYEYVGENYPCNGLLVMKRPLGETRDVRAGQWSNGVYIPDEEE